MNQKANILIIIIGALIFLCLRYIKKDKTDSPDNQSGTVKRVDVTKDTLKKMMSENKDLLILDVRNPEELLAGPAPLKNAVNIPLPELATRHIELPRDKDIVVVCLSGMRSANAANMLIRAGFTRIYNLKGGMSAYKASEK